MQKIYTVTEHRRAYLFEAQSEFMLATPSICRLKYDTARTEHQEVQQTDGFRETTTRGPVKEFICEAMTEGRRVRHPAVHPTWASRHNMLCFDGR